MRSQPLVVGFDLDMTLIDPRDGVARALTALEEELAAGIDVGWAVDNLGPPAELVLGRWIPAEGVESAARRYRELFAEVGLRTTKAMPRAIDAVDAVRAAGGKVIVVTAKYGPHALESLRAIGLSTDGVFGQRFATEKAAVLLAHQAQIYVGDHPADILAARSANAVAVTVATGPAGPEELVAAGADVVLHALNDFPIWLDEHMRAVEEETRSSLNPHTRR